jgi:hypothetical protein
MVPLAGIPMAPEWRGTVITAVQATAAAAALLLGEERGREAKMVSSWAGLGDRLML